MTEDSLRLIESRLGIRLPVSYRALHHDHANRLQKLDWSDAAINPLYLTAENVIAPNIEERRPEMGTACAFPNWWETFVLIGTNGGGDYYSLRLDNTEGVWLIGSDCGETPTRVADILQQYVEQTIAEHEAAKALEAERVRRRAPFQKEIEAHLAVVARDRGSLELVRPEWAGAGSPLAAKWITCDGIYPMFEWLKGRDAKVSPRKLRLYGLALCRLIPGVEDDADCAAGMALAKAMTLGTAKKPQISKMRSGLRSKIEHLMENYRSFDQETYGKILWRTKAVYWLFQDDDGYSSNAPIYPNDPDLARVYDAAGHAIAGHPYGVEQAPDLLREVLGNPFHPAPILPQWRTPEVVSLARTILQDEGFDHLPELAMVLAKTGCLDERILAHCQRSNDHVRGCWVVDAILEKT
jgi:SMI1 / KNR4 family (SUKH-1)